MLSSLLVFCSGLLVGSIPKHAKPTRRFDFGPAKAGIGYQRVTNEDIYTREKGYGFEPGFDVKCFDRSNFHDDLKSDICTSDRPFYFSVALAEGNYLVRVTLGDAENAT